MAKKRRRVAWNAAHVRTLKSMAKKKHPAKKIAKALKRTEGAIKQLQFRALEKLRAEMEGAYA